MTDDKAALDRDAEQFAERHKVELRGVKRVFRGLAKRGTPWLPNDARPCVLDIVAAHVGPARALEIAAATSDLCALDQWAALLADLVYPMTPLHTVAELCTLAGQFLGHLKRNRHWLTQCGHPRWNFNKCRWLDLHLTPLYFTKVPLTYGNGRGFREQAEAERQGKADTDDAGNFEYAYTWPREPIAIGIFVHRPDLVAVRNEAPCSVSVAAHLRGWIGGHAFGEPGPIEQCDYADASLIQEIEADEATRLEQLRPRLLALKQAVLRRLSRAQRSDSAEGLWDDCLSILTDTDSDGVWAEEADFLISIDNRFGGSSESPADSATEASCRFGPLPCANGGLSDLLKVIGHFEKELTIGTMDKTATALRNLEPKVRQGSYWQLLGTTVSRDLDSALSEFARLEQEEEAFWREYEYRVNEAIRRKFRVEEGGTWVPREMATDPDFRHMRASFVAQVRDHKLETGYLPSVSVGAQAATVEPQVETQPPPVAEERPNVFRNRGATWDVRWDARASVSVEHTKGMYYIAYLLARPWEWFPATLLVHALDNGLKSLPELEDQPGKWSEAYVHGLRSIRDRRVLDAILGTARNLKEVNQQLLEAKDRGDGAQMAELQTKRCLLNKSAGGAEDSRGVGLKVDQEAHNDRRAVCNAIRRAIDWLYKRHPAVAEHIDDALDTGYWVRYEPYPVITWDVALDLIP